MRAIFTSDATFDKLVKKTSQAGYVFRFDMIYQKLYEKDVIDSLAKNHYPLELEFDFTKSVDRAVVAQLSSTPVDSNCIDYPNAWTDIEGDGCSEYAADNGWYWQKVW